MKNWQFCMLTATVWIAPHAEGWYGAIATAVFLVGSAIMMVKER